MAWPTEKERNDCVQKGDHARYVQTGFLSTGDVVLWRVPLVHVESADGDGQDCSEADDGDEDVIEDREAEGEDGLGGG